MMIDFKTADISDTFGVVARPCTMQFRRFGKRSRFCGVVETVRTFEDAGLAIDCLAHSGTGKVLVIDGRASMKAALLGDKMARQAIENGWAGIVVHGAIRDSAEIGELDIAILALGTAPARGSKEGTGEIHVPVSFGDVVFNPGDSIYADEDGVIVLPRSVAC
jgi:regulator of ribonuclease activity A